MSRYRISWQELQEQVNGVNEFTQVFVVRYRDPLNKKRFAIPYKDKKSADDKMAQLKRDGVKEIEITQDTLRGNIKFKEEVDLQEFTKSQIDMLKKNYEPMRGKTISPQKASMLSGIMDRQFSDISSLKQLAKADIPFVSTLAKNKLYKKTGKFEDMKKDVKEENDHEISMARGELEAIADKATQLSSMLQGKSDDGNPLEAWVQSKITKAKDYINSVADYLIYNPDMKEDTADDMERIANLRTRQMIKQTQVRDLDPAKDADKITIKKNDIENIQIKIDNIKDKVQKQQTSETADLTKGQVKKVHKMADELPKKDFKDRYGKEKGDSVRYATATNIVKDKEGIKEMQQIDEKQIEGIKNKSEKSGIPYGILKQVYNRGMAAWKGGHRPGTTPQQWAFARVNAFITKGKAYYTADADLAKKARAAKKGKK